MIILIRKLFISYLFNTDYGYIGEELDIYDYETEKDSVVLERYLSQEFKYLDWI